MRRPFCLGWHFTGQTKRPRRHQRGLAFEIADWRALALVAFRAGVRRRLGPASTRTGSRSDRRAERCGTATRDALAHGGSGEIAVLLSPACASFDQFPNFEVRGDSFRKLVAELPGFEPFGGKR